MAPGLRTLSGDRGATESVCNSVPVLTHLGQSNGSGLAKKGGLGGGEIAHGLWADERIFEELVNPVRRMGRSCYMGHCALAQLRRQLRVFCQVPMSGYHSNGFASRSGGRIGRPFLGDRRPVPATDVELIERMATGDSAAFAEFHDRHSGRVCGLLVKMLRNRAEAEDALQETFWQVWSQAARYRPERSSPFFWLVMIARSRAIDLSRRRRPSVGVVTEDSRIQTDVEAAMELSEEADRMRDALVALPEEQSNAIRHAFYGGMTHEQIAASQSLPLGTVKTRIRLGMRRLREILTEDGKALAS